MLRNTVILTLLISTLVATFDKGFIVLNFFANQKYIAQNLCENRNKPKLNCCGKCQLRKKINQEEKNSQLPARQGIDDILFYSEPDQYNFNSELNNPVKNTFSTVVNIPHPYFDIFHPPQATSF